MQTTANTQPDVSHCSKLHLSVDHESR